MPTEQDEASLELEPEIAHLLLIDIVGYSTLLVNAQVELLRELNRVVRETTCVRKAEEQGRLLKVPTGDGMALLFFRSPEEPVRCALEIARTLKGHPTLQIRMGVHSGPINTVTDVNDQPNVAGAGINKAQRVMDCGDAGHILTSKHVADDLEQYRHWKPFLHDLGECEVKHGVRLHLFNLYKNDLGNPAVPQKLRRFGWRKGRGTLYPGPDSWTPRLALIAIALVALIAVAMSLWGMFRRAGSHASPPGASLIPNKSIAVLPFENLSDDKQSAYFADGVHDEILNDLSKVADLKVISRTSVMQYKNTTRRNLREIAKALGVAHILEGTVQPANGRVRVSAQLIDARTDTHVWGERYDREMANVFAIENELSEKIVAQLKSKLSPQEKAAIEQKPTSDLAAYDLYERAKTLIENSTLNLPQQESLEEAVRLLNQAVQNDPAFALAYYQLAHAHDLLYFTGIDHTPARLAMADAAIKALARLRPNSGETHLTLAKHYYWGYRDYDRAREQLELAKKSLPNDPWPFLLTGYIDRRQSRWAESTSNLERAVELDPLNPEILQQLARSYTFLRRYPDAEKSLDLAIALAPKEAAMRAARAEIELLWHADPRPLSSTIQAILTENPRDAANVAEFWLEVALCHRDSDAAQRALAALPIDGCQVENIPFPKSWCEGLVAQIRADNAAARATFTAARNEVARLVKQEPEYAQALGALGLADAALGYKEDAIREGRRAVELLPLTKESINGSLLIQYLALIYAWTGEKDLALEQLAIAARIPGYLSYGQLRLHPYWDTLRGDPRFEEIVASLAPKDNRL